MFYCTECKKMSDSTKSRSEWQGEKEHGGYVVYDTCPHCGSDEIEKAGECEICGVWIPSDKDYCHFCEEKVNAVMRSAFEQLEKTANVEANILSVMAEWIEKQ